MGHIKDIEEAFGIDKPTDAHSNLLGAYLDIQRTGKCDEVSNDTIARVLAQLDEIKFILIAASIREIS